MPCVKQMLHRSPSVHRDSGTQKPIRRRGKGSEEKLQASSLLRAGLTQRIWPKKIVATPPFEDLHWVYRFGIRLISASLNCICNLSLNLFKFSDLILHTRAKERKRYFTVLAGLAFEGKHWYPRKIILEKTVLNSLPNSWTPSTQNVLPFISQS